MPPQRSGPPASMATAAAEGAAYHVRWPGEEKPAEGGEGERTVILHQPVSVDWAQQGPPRGPPQQVDLPLLGAVSNRCSLFSGRLKEGVREVLTIPWSLLGSLEPEPLKPLDSSGHGGP